MRNLATKRLLGFFLTTSALVWAAACGRTTIDFGVPDSSGGTSGNGGVGGVGGAQGGSAGIGGIGGSAGAGAEGGVGGDAGFGGSGAEGGFGGNGGNGGATNDCLAQARTNCNFCTCDNCFDEWQDCSNDSGCVAVANCATAAGCSGAQCLGPCGDIIRQHGGPQGQSVQLALAVGTCQATSCGEDCNGGSGGAGGNGGAAGSGGSGGGGVVDCISCVATDCPSAQECLLDAACRDGAICAVTDCLGGGGGGGGLDFQCLLGCFNGDINAALTAFNSVQCVLTSCADDCGGILGGGGGGTPFGGGGGGTPFGGFGGGN